MVELCCSQAGVRRHVKYYNTPGFVDGEKILTKKNLGHFFRTFFLFNQGSELSTKVQYTEMEMAPL